MKLCITTKLEIRGVFLKGSIKLSFVLIVAIVFAVGCGNNNEEIQEQPENDVEVKDNEVNESEQNEENELDESNADETELVEGTVELSDTIDEITDFYNTIHFSEIDIIDQEEGIAVIEASKVVDSNDFEVLLRGYTLDGNALLDLVVKSGEAEYERQADRNMAEKVKDGVYESGDTLVWEEGGNSYGLRGGRSVISSNEDNNIEPAEDRLLFYGGLTKTNNELDGVNEFIDEIIFPTILPSDYNLSSVTIKKNTREVLAVSYPEELVYVMKGADGSALKFVTYGSYENALQLVGDGLEELEIEGVTVQTKGQEVLFTIGDKTYHIQYEDITLDDVLEIVKSMIEQSE